MFTGETNEYILSLNFDVVIIIVRSLINIAVYISNKLSNKIAEKNNILIKEKHETLRVVPY